MMTKLSLTKIITNDPSLVGAPMEDIVKFLAKEVLSLKRQVRQLTKDKNQ